MARRKDLAGIAALAGLGMLLANRSKKGNDEDTKKRQTAADKMVDAEIKSMNDESGMDPEEAANKRTERMLIPNQRGAAGTSETMYPPAKPSATTTPALKPMAQRYQPAAARPNPNFSNEGRQKPVGQTSRYQPKADRPNQNFSNEGRQGPVGQTSVSANQIPGQSAKAPTGGERADSSEAERNINAALTATGVGAAGATAYKAKKMYDASQKAKAAAEAAAKGREAVTNPLSWMAGPKNAGKFAGEVPAAGRESVTNPMSWMGGPKNVDKFKEAAPSAMDRAKTAAEKFADRFRKKPLDEADTTGGAIGYKRGGKVRGYASGGSVSSASSRADGIATKGKTRGKIY
jgi:hypothetical protein